jgi:hypothetical protein
MPEPTPTPTPNPTPTPPPQDDIKALKDQVAALLKEKESWSKGTPSPEDPSLTDKVKKEQDDRNRKNSDVKELESALVFNMSSTEFLKSNSDFLPKDVADIFKVADKETYASPIEKSNATKAAIIQSFFSQQANLESLTHGQQSVLADYLKLTKNGKEEKAREMYDTLFEPALASIKRVKKAEEIMKANQGYGSNTDADQAYKDKLMKMADKKFSRGKN